MLPRSGDRIVLDAQTFADYLIGIGRGRHTNRSQAAEILLASCCVAVYSTKLRKESVGAVQRRGIPVPQRAIVRILEQHRRKLVPVPQSKLDAMPVDAAILRHVNAKDRHVAHLAVCGAAPWVVTADRKFREECAAPAVAALFTALSPEEIPTSGGQEGC